MESITAVLPFLFIIWQSDDLPAFVKIIDFIIINNVVLIQVEEYNTEGINDHLLSYLIKPTHQTSFLHLSKSFMYHVYHPHKYLGDNSLYICNRSIVERA